MSNQWVRIRHTSGRAAVVSEAAFERSYAGKGWTAEGVVEPAPEAESKRKGGSRRAAAAGDGDG